MNRTEYFLARAEWHEAEARELRRMAELEKFSSSADGFRTQPNYGELPVFRTKVSWPTWKVVEPKPSPTDAAS